MITHLKLQYLASKNPAITEMISRLDLVIPENTTALKIDNRIRAWIQEFQVAPKPRQVERSPFLMTDGSDCPPIFRKTADIAVWIKNNNFTL
jgi:hypothetical protein